MTTIVVGSGFTGVQLARTLLREKHHVVMIDNDAERVREIGNQLDCAVICSNGNSLETLEDVGIASADALVALMPSDETNMITCALADAAYPKVLKIARVRNFEYYTDTVSAKHRFAATFSDDRRPPFGIDWIVNPDVEAAAAIGRAVAYGVVGGVIELSDGYGMVNLPIGRHSQLDGTPLCGLHAVEGWENRLVAYVETPDGPVLPSGQTVIRKGCRIGVLAPLSDIPSLIDICDAPKVPRGKVAVVGAGRVGSLVVMGRKPEARSANVDKMLGIGWKVDGSEEIAVVDEDMARCRAMAAQYRGVRVLCGNAMDEDLIREEGLDSYDLLVAASENPERNLVTAAYMKSVGVRRVIALTSASSVFELSLKLGIDVTVPMRDTVVDCIMSHLRGRSVRSVHTVCNGAFELVECVVAEKSKAAGKPLRELGLSDRGIVLFVKSPKGRSVVPHGDTVIGAGDNVTLVTPAGDNRALKVFG